MSKRPGQISQKDQSRQKAAQSQPSARQRSSSRQAVSAAPGGVREVTPEMRARTARTFGLVILGFVAGIALMVAVLSAQGRALREYAVRVQTAVLATGPSVNVSYGQPCVDALPGALPSGVLSCDVQVSSGQVSVLMQLERDREFRLAPKAAAAP
ncbi:hypothetical protein [Deinococcus aquaticus]|uniref:DUF4333 domain-containing protein n=1 Tax=Deinococcus aquaticus TaxID=328692 RepID=A0ABY7UYB5_9DEIO|nr:hypothetical protein [Deinococcus aquaticus]WDA57561.1 hypothetical protein M8445_09315 [Deinococcus aquaticus]